MMPKLSGIKKTNPKNKFICESEDCNDFLIESNDPKLKMTQKRARNLLDAELMDRKGVGDVPSASEENGDDDFVGKFQSIIQDKRRKVDSFTNESLFDGQKKLKDFMEKQADMRRQCTDRLMRSLSAILTQLESDGAALAENEQRLQRLTAAQLKTAQQGIAVHAQRLQALKDIHGSYLKSCEAMEKSHREECAALAEEMSREARETQRRLVKESRRSGLETLRKSMLEYMQCDI